MRSHYQSVADSIRTERFYLFHEQRLALPEARVWDVVPTSPRGRLRPGQRWTDTLDLNAERGPFRQGLTGERVSTLVRDTLVEGRRLWIVRDSARVRYEEEWVERERTLDTLATVHRTVEGVIRGRHLYAPEIGLFRVRSDTARLTGEAVLRYPDGRAFQTPARYERTRDWTLYDSATHAVRIAALESERGARYRGMVLIADNEMERRLAAGDRRLQDSIIAEWRSTSDPNQREELLRMLSYWGRLTPDAKRELLRMRLPRGLYGRLSVPACTAHAGSSERIPFVSCCRSWPTRG